MSEIESICDNIQLYTFRIGTGFSLRFVKPVWFFKN